MADFAFRAGKPWKPGHDTLTSQGFSHDMEKEGDGKHDIHTYTRGKYSVGAVVNRKTGKVAHVGSYTDDKD